MCAIFGMMDYAKNFSAKQRAKIMKVLGTMAEVRGTDATGYAYLNNGNLEIVKEPVAAHRLKLRLPESANIIIGHTRAATHGNKYSNYNNHPFIGNVGNKTFALAHNGVLWNYEELREEHNIPQTRIETDSYIAVQLLEKFGLSDEGLSRMAEEVWGSFMFTVLDDKGTVYLIKGDNPICLYHFHDGFYMYASTEEILKRALKKLRIKGAYTKIILNEGDIMKISRKGAISMAKFQPQDTYSYGRAATAAYADYGYSDLEILESYAHLMGIKLEVVEEMLLEGWEADEILDLMVESPDFIYEYASSFYSEDGGTDADDEYWSERRAVQGGVMS